MTNPMIYVYASLITGGATLIAGTLGAGLAAYFQRNRATESRRSDQIERFRERVAELVLAMRTWQQQAELAPVALGSPRWKNIDETTESEFLSGFGTVMTDADGALILAELTISDAALLAQLASIRKGLDAFRTSYAKIGLALAEAPKDRARRVDLVGPTLGIATLTKQRVGELVMMTQALK